MKTVSIQAVKSSLLSMISPKKADKVAATAIKDGEKLMAAGQDASAMQAKAMIKPYEAPKMEQVNLNRTKTQGSSGGTGGGKDPWEEDPNENDW